MVLLEENFPTPRKHLISIVVYEVLFGMYNTNNGALFLHQFRARTRGYLGDLQREFSEEKYKDFIYFFLFLFFFF